MRHVELDIGCGKGTFLRRIARENPENRYIGIDINEHRCQQTENGLKQDRLKNAIIVHEEANIFIERYVPTATVSAVHIYFPTPYFGEIRQNNMLGRSIKRWLVTEEFLRTIHKICQPGAILRIATDHQRYFRSIEDAVDASSFQVVPWTNPIQSRAFDNLVGTGCEREQRALGKSIYFIQCLA